MRLAAATDAEKRQRDAVTYPAWGQGLTLEQFLAREVALRAHPFCREDMETWLWRGADGEVLSSCETFRLASRVGAVEGESYSVASVYTEPALRGRGHAGRMMRALVDVLARRPRAQASVLFSDVGAPLYEQAGYRAVDAFDLVLAPSPAPAAGVELLAEPLAAPPPLPVSPGALAVVPSAAELDWHLERERFYARALGRPRPSACGAAVGASRACWAVTYKSNELCVLWLALADAAHATPLLQAARRAAHQAGVAQVRVWDSGALPPVPEARRVPRDGELPMYAPFVAGVEAWAGVQRGLWV